MTGIEIHSASPPSASSSEQLSTLEVAKQAAGSMSRSSSVSPGTVELAPVSTNQLNNIEAPTLSESRTPARMSTASTARAMPRLSIRSSISEAPLPWKIDETSSPYSPTSQGHKASFVPPPPRAGYRGSVDNAKPELIHTSSSPTQLVNEPSTPYSTRSSYSHTTDLSNPPGYTQDARSSFSDRSAQIPMYDNSTPFYQNNYSSYTSSVSSPITPTRRGRGILDNDPSLYLRGEADIEEETYWDTASRWAKAAGKRVSQGEQQLWKMVSAVASGEGDR